MSRPNQDTDKRVMERIKQQSADEHAKYMAKKMLSEKRQTIIDENDFLKGRIEELEAGNDLLREERLAFANLSRSLQLRIEELESHADALSGELELAKSVIEELESQLAEIRDMAFNYDPNIGIKVRDMFRSSINREKPK